MVGLDNPLHIALVLVVVLLVFGAKRLPEMGKGIGEGMRGFKQAISGEAEQGPAPIGLSPVEETAAPKATVAPERTSAPVA